MGVAFAKGEASNAAIPYHHEIVVNASLYFEVREALAPRCKLEVSQTFDDLSAETSLVATG